MSLTVVGSIAFDAVETQTAKRDRLLGGAAVHFSLASSFLAETRVIGRASCRERVLCVV